MSTQATITAPAKGTFHFVNNVWKSFRTESGLERRLFFGLVNHDEENAQPVLSITRAELGKVDFNLNIQDRHTNRLNILHGGTIASLVDFGGSLAVASRGLFSTGVSTDLNVSYLGSGGKVGDKIKVEATCDKLGRTLAFTTVKIFNEEGLLVARGSHTKYIKDAQSSQVELGGFFRYPGRVRAELERIRALKAAQAAQTGAMQATSEEDQAKVEEATEEVKAAEQPTEEVEVTEQPTEEEKTKE